MDIQNTKTYQNIGNIEIFHIFVENSLLPCQNYQYRYLYRKLFFEIILICVEISINNIDIEEIFAKK